MQVQHVPQFAYGKDIAVRVERKDRPTVFYHLGVRHAVRARTTKLMFGEGSRLPLDVAELRALSYSLSEDGRPSSVDLARGALTRRLLEWVRNRSWIAPSFN